MLNVENQIFNDTQSSGKCGCVELEKKIDESAKQIVSLKKSFAPIENYPTEKVDLSYLNTKDDPEYVSACERSRKNKLLEKRWNKYNWFEKFILIVLGILFLRMFALENKHPVLLESHWAFYFFKKS